MTPKPHNVHQAKTDMLSLQQDLCGELESMECTQIAVGKLQSAE